MNHVGSETHRPIRRSIGVTRHTRRIAAALSITAATVLTVQADTAGAASCSLRVIATTADSMTLRYDPHDGHARTVWVDGQPTTIAPHSTAVVPAVEQFEYVDRGSWLVTADLIRECGDGSTTTTTSSTTTSTVPTTTSTVPTTTSTSALTTITVVRTTPEPTTSTAPLPPATWTVADPTTTTLPGKRTTLPETGGGRTAATVGLSLLALGAIALDVWRRDQRRRG